MTLKNSRNREHNSLDPIYDLEARYRQIKYIPDELLKPFQERDKELYQAEWKHEAAMKSERTRKLKEAVRLQREQEREQRIKTAKQEAKAREQELMNQEQRERSLRMTHMVKKYWLEGADNGEIAARTGLKKSQIYDLVKRMKNHGLLPDGHREAEWKMISSKTGNILTGTMTELVNASGFSRTRLRTNSVAGWRVEKTGKLVTVKDGDRAYGKDKFW
ncbi:hypothetical protein PQ472_07890 [Lacticaseibacillus pabuli]|uniref:Uncharacterized protein n=1 Tax=Lacticaseibacillus pabuli TaxID=3025672 RepID=A0ABY7WSA6_9LACO|nr:hypothetical protein [Lacticaseibacillus sp. KACC 23028]WDF81846.1 hypothetical protein PQ472_07890 [Lacticaseibacillus sp. KACC 23028]